MVRKMEIFIAKHLTIIPSQCKLTIHDVTLFELANTHIIRMSYDAIILLLIFLTPH